MKQGFYSWQVPGRTIRVSLALIDSLNLGLSDTRLNQTEEQGGILYGTAVDGIPAITRFEFFKSEHRRGIAYDLGARERARLGRIVASQMRKRGEKPIGFFRTHLRPGFFLDQDDFSLMSESFANPGSIALLVRPEQDGTRDAGFFYWEGGDIDRRQTQLVFPFDSTAVSPEWVAPAPSAPVDSSAPGRLAAMRRLSPAWQLPTIPPEWAAAALVVPAFAAVVALHHTPAQAAHRVSQPPAIAWVAPAPQKVESAPVAELREVPAAEPVPRPEIQAEQAPPAVFVETRVARTPPIEPTNIAASRNPVAEVAPAPAVAVVAPPAVVVEPAKPQPERQKTVLVAVTLEPRVTRPESPSELRKVVGHVPLLGHPFRRKEEEFTPPRPEHRLEPRVPRYLAGNLLYELPVDVRLSIDSRGVVQNAEVLRGRGTTFAALAADSASATSWHPALLGEHEVPSEMIVHYRFRAE